MKQNKLANTLRDVPSCPEEVGLAVLEVLPDRHVELSSAIVRDGSLLVDFSEAGAPASPVGGPSAASTHEHPLEVGLRRRR